jgi:hypothetical protein
VIFVAGGDFSFDDDPTQSQWDAICSVQRTRWGIDRPNGNQDIFSGSISGTAPFTTNRNI